MEKNLYTLDGAINRLTTDYFKLVYLDRAFKSLIIVNAIAGTIFLILRYLNIQTTYLFFVYSVLFFIVLIESLLYAFKHKIKKDKCLAVIDDCNSSGGVIVASAETGDNSWLNNPEITYSIPKLVSKSKISPFIIICSFVFLLLCFYIPVFRNGILNSRVNINELEQKTINKVEVLKNIGLLSNKEAEQYLKALENIGEKSDRNSMSKTLEALDRLQEKLDQKINDAAASLVSEKNELNKLQNYLDNEDTLFLKDSEVNKYLKQAKIETSEDEVNRKEAEKELRNYINNRNKEIDNTLNKLITQGLLSPKVAENVLNGQNYSNESKKAVEEVVNTKQYIDSYDSHKNENSNNESKTEQYYKKTSEGNSYDKNNELDNEFSLNKETGDNNTKGNENNEKKGNAGECNNCEQNGLEGFSESEHSEDDGSAPINYNRKTSKHDVKYKDFQINNYGKIDTSRTISIGIGRAVPNQEDLAGKNIFKGQISNNEVKSVHSDRDLILPQHRNAVINYFGDNGVR